MTARALEMLGLSLLEQDLKSNRYSKDHTRSAMKYARVFLCWLKENEKGSLALVRRKDLVLYQSWLGTLVNKRTGSLYATATLDSYYNAVKKLFSLLYRTGAITENPAHGLELRLPGAKRAFKRRPLSREEITTFLESIAVDDAKGLRNRAFFELIYSSGLRNSEARAIKIGSIDFQQRQLVVRGKYDRERVVPLSDVARDFLLSYLGARKDAVDDYVFFGADRKTSIHRSTMNKNFRQIAESCGLDKKELCVHSIRHSTATHLLDNGAGVRHVQELLGHRSIESTVMYTHVQTEGLARIYRKYHPREHELFEAVDEAYDKRLESIARDKFGRLLTGEPQAPPWKLRKSGCES